MVYYKENYFNKTNQEDLAKEKNLEKKKKILDEKIKKTYINKKDDKVDIKKKRFEILKNNLIYLRDNHVTPHEYMEYNPFNFKPFQLKESINLLDCVKYDKFEEMEILLRNSDLLFCYDYFHQTAFHWAAKRNKLRALRTMLIYGKCINLYDLNRMTPLALAAQNNNYDMVVLLCDNGANPFMRNIEGKKPSDLCTDFKTKSYLLYIEDTFPTSLKKNNKKK